MQVHDARPGSAPPVQPENSFVNPSVVFQAQAQPEWSAGPGLGLPRMLNFPSRNSSANGAAGAELLLHQSKGSMNPRLITPEEYLREQLMRGAAGDSAAQGLLKIASNKNFPTESSGGGFQPFDPQTLTGSLLAGLSEDVHQGQGALPHQVDALFGGITSANPTPRSSINNMAPLMEADSRQHQLNSSFTGRPRSQALPSKLGLGTASVEQQTNAFRVGSPLSLGQVHQQVPVLGLQDTLSNLSLNIDSVSADLVPEHSAQHLQDPYNNDPSAYFRPTSSSAAGSSHSAAMDPAQQQQQQLQAAMYLSMYGYAPRTAQTSGHQMGYPSAQYAPAQYASANGTAQYASANGSVQYASANGTTQFQGLSPGMISLAQAGHGQHETLVMPQQQRISIHSAPAGVGYSLPGTVPFPAVSPAEYAEYYQRCMENQALMAAGMVPGLSPLQPGLVTEPFVVSSTGQLHPQHMADVASMDAVRARRSIGSHGADQPRGYLWQGVDLGHKQHLGPSHLGHDMQVTTMRGDASSQHDQLATHFERMQLGGHGMAGLGGLGGMRRAGGRREGENVLTTRGSIFLEEFKANKTRKFEFSDILGHVFEFSLDQHGSRFIQQKLEMANRTEVGLALAEILPRAAQLITDVFGNYVVQKFFEKGSEEQRQQLAATLKGQVLGLSLQMYGCRVVQKALEVLPPDTQCELLAELDGNVMRCVRDQNGNHVIQKIIECVPTDRITALIDNFLTCIVPLSTHPFGCRVIQRILEHCKDTQRKSVVLEEILRNAHQLSQDQYANYVIQHVMEHGCQADKTCIVTVLQPHVVTLSMHKFASNVVEKCLAYCLPLEREALIKAILNTGEGGSAPCSPTDSSQEGFGLEDSLQQMMRDQYGNYVVQKVLEVCDDEQREHLMARVRAQLHLLKKFTYGKHIVTRVEKLLSAGTKIQSHLRSRPLPNDTQSLSSVRLNRPTTHNGVISLPSSSASPDGSEGLSRLGGTATNSSNGAMGMM